MAAAKGSKGSEGSGGSRLDRLLRVLEGGSTALVKREAGKQLADLCASHTRQLPAFLWQIAPFLTSPSWDTRAEAAGALGLIARHYRHPTGDAMRAAAGDAPAPVKREDGDAGAAPAVVTDGGIGRLSLANLRVTDILATGAELVKGATKDQLEWEAQLRSMKPEERRELLRKQLVEEFGLDPEGGLSRAGVDVTAMLGVKVEDLDDTDATAARVEHPDAGEVVEGMAGLTPRERMMMKRKQKRAGKDERGGKRQKGAGGAGGSLFGTMTVEQDLDAEWERICAGSWPFQVLCDELCHALVDPAWEARHGAAAALREILVHHARSCAVQYVPDAGEVAPFSDAGEPLAAPMGADAAAASLARHTAWVEDCACRLIAVLALDRLSDIQASRVVGPVRETAAQALGSLGQAFSEHQARLVVEALATLCEADPWPARQGGLLGIKYLLASAAVPRALVVDRVVPVLRDRLSDKEDACQVEAAEGLNTILEVLTGTDPAAGPHPDLPVVLEKMWGSLRTADDLDPFCASSMSSLSKVYELLLDARGGAGECDPARLALASAGLADRAPRCLPFLAHPMAYVRRAAVQAAGRLCRMPNAAALWLDAALPRVLSALLLAMLTEEDGGIRAECGRVWRHSLAAASPGAVEGACAASTVRAWFQVCATPVNQPPDREALDVVRDMAGGEKGQRRWRRAAAYVPGAQGEAQMLCGLLTVATALGELVTPRTPAAGDLVASRAAQLLTAPSPSFCGRLLAASTLAAAGDCSGAAESSAPSRFADVLARHLAATSALAAADVGYVELQGWLETLRAQALALRTLVAKLGVDLPAPAGMTWDAPTAAGCAQLVAGPCPEASDAELANSISTSWFQVGKSANAVLDYGERIHRAVLAAVADARLRSGPLPDKLAGIIKPLMASVRQEADSTLSDRTAEALASLAVRAEGQKAAEKVVGNLCKMAVAVAPRADASGAVAAAEGVQGPASALRALLRRLGVEAPRRAPGLWAAVSGALASGGPAPDAMGQAELDTLHLLGTLACAFDAGLAPQITALLPACAGVLRSPGEVFRATASQCIAKLSTWQPGEIMPKALNLLSAMLADMTSDAARRGAAEALTSIISSLDPTVLVPYVPLLLTPFLARMSDPDADVRRLATGAFGLAVPLLPLAQGQPPPPGLTPAQAEQLKKDSVLLEQILDRSRCADWRPPIEVKADLRSYQQEGINWLAFLRRFGLHGVLADDMGLGKTLQASIIVGSSMHDYAERHQRSGLPGEAPLPSLVVSPSTLVDHWCHEVAKFIPADVLRPLSYQGQASARAALRPSVGTGPQERNLVVMSYETLRSEAEWVRSQRWDYAILDEGHIIKSSKSKIAIAAAGIVARHRLLLSGTPIQNNLLELWSLFDFLMPGLLGTEKEFNVRYGRSVRVARASGRGMKDGEEAVLALEGLHKRVMPFILRRTKGQVLKDLPPKTIQDIFVDPSPFQLRLQRIMEDARGAAGQPVPGDAKASDGGAPAPPHVFQALQYMRRLCAHPVLALDTSSPEHVQAIEEDLGVSGAASMPPDKLLGATRAALRDLSHAPKLRALRDLLLGCGIGSSSDEGEDGAGAEGGGGDAGHRILVFCQAKALLDIVEDDVLRPLGASWVRLDGSVEASQRFGVAQTFNNDPSVDVMLLTTHVGGLGLNLTAADTVVFLEHDWNPQKDLQAMDRAHRIGQRRAVNVYRLLTRGTLEERIMSLQQFKLDVAGAVVNADNVSMKSMDTSKLLDLFGSGGGEVGEAAAAGDATGVDALGEVTAGSKQRKGGLQAMLEELDKKVADEERYAEDFDVAAFGKRLRGGA
ncbi:unnamed protein product [Pedinophyceae sp. YPF-701]|nr:unnamed protein product [Pedinophyceae sp. YPF-701]